MNVTGRCRLFDKFDYLKKNEVRNYILRLIRKNIIQTTLLNSKPNVVHYILIELKLET